MENIPEEYREEYAAGAIPFFPNHIIKEAMMALGIIAVIIFLATFFPAALEQKADPFDTPAHIKPEWYFLAMYQTLKIVPNEMLAIMGQGVFFLLLIFIPFLDRNPDRRLRQRPVAAASLVLIIIILVILTWWGKIS